MAIALDTTSTSQGNAVSSVTWAHTCAGSNLLLWVGVGSGANTPHLTSNVTYHGITRTGEAFDITSGFSHVSGSYLVAPDTGGAFNVIGTIAAADDEVIVGAVSYTGVDQSVPIGTPSSAGSFTVNIASATGELVVDAQYTANWTSGAGSSTTGGNTARVNNTDSGDGFGWMGMSDKAGAASVTMSWDSDSTQHTIGGVSLKPVSAGGSTRTPTIGDVSLSGIAPGRVVGTILSPATMTKI